MKSVTLMLAAVLFSIFLCGCATLKAWSELQQRCPVDCSMSCKECCRK